MSEIREYRVGMSVEALAAAWARTEEAPAGATVVVGTEIAGRLRGGVPWTTQEPDGLMMAVVVRPEISPLQEALLWLVVSLAAARAASGTSGAEHGTSWPDTVVRSSDGEPCVRTNVIAQLGPGRVDHAVLSVRAAVSELGVGRDAFVSAVQSELAATVEQLEVDSLGLVAAYTEVSSIMDQRVLVTMLPRGEARGTVTAIDPEGFLVLRSTTGMLERIAPATLRTLALHVDNT